MFLRTAIALAVWAVFAGGTAVAQEKNSKKPADDKSKGAKKEGGWAVVQVGEELMVVEESAIADLQKEVLKENKDRAKKKAKKGEKPEPQKSFRPVKRNLATRQDAEKELKKIEEEKEKEKEKKEQKDKEKAAEKAAKKDSKKKS